MSTSSTVQADSASAESPTEPTYLTPAQAGAILHRKPWPVVRAIEAGKLRAFRPDDDGPWLIRPADLAAYVEGTEPVRVSM